MSIKTPSPKSSTPISASVIFKGTTYSDFSSCNKFFASSSVIAKSVPGEPKNNSKGSCIIYAFRGSVCTSE